MSQKIHPGVTLKLYVKMSASVSNDTNGWHSVLYFSETENSSQGWVFFTRHDPHAGDQSFCRIRNQVLAFILWTSRCNVLCQNSFKRHHILCFASSGSHQLTKAQCCPAREAKQSTVLHCASLTRNWMFSFFKWMFKLNSPTCRL